MAEKQSSMDMESMGEHNDIIYQDIDPASGCYIIPEKSDEAAGSTGLEATIPRKFKLKPVENVDPQYAEKQRKQLETLATTKKATTKDFYRAQSYQQLGDAKQRVHVPIWIDSDHVDKKWKKCLDHGIAEINKAAPGLHIYTVYSKDDSKIFVEEHDDPQKASTRGSIILHSQAQVRLGRNFPNCQKMRAATHEMLHALGFEHEHQREDAAKSIKTASGAVASKSMEKANSTTRKENSSTESSTKNQVRPTPEYIGITRFDPFSIMLYPECQFFTRKDGKEGDAVWELKPGTKVNVEMSDLDKVGLNMVYRPCEGHGYNPVISPRTGLIYCGRKGVMSQHNIPNCRVTTTCGPETGPNCPACRTINTTEVKKLTGRHDGDKEEAAIVQGQEDSGNGGPITSQTSGGATRGKERWQGLSGLFYCGCTFEQPCKFWKIQIGTRTSDCGPDSGEPCEECKRLLKL